MTKVLIVDDEVEVRQFLSRSLADCGYAIGEARDGSEALAYLATEHPDVVITDLLMPVMDGFELALRIRADPEHAATEVIFFTGRASPRQVKAMAETAGVAQVVTKPATIDEVQEAVDAALHRKHCPNPENAASLAANQDQTSIEEHSAPKTGASAIVTRDPENADRFGVLFARTLDAILLFTSDGRCLDANPAAIRLLGYSHDTLSNLTLWDLTPPKDLQARRELWDQFLALGQVRQKYPLVRQDGSYRELELSAVSNLEPGVHLTMWRDVGPSGPSPA